MEGGRGGKKKKKKKANPDNFAVDGAATARKGAKYQREVGCSGRSPPPLLPQLQSLAASPPGGAQPDPPSGLIPRCWGGGGKERFKEVFSQTYLPRGSLCEGSFAPEPDASSEAPSRAELPWQGKGRGGSGRWKGSGPNRGGGGAPLSPGKAEGRGRGGVLRGCISSEPKRFCLPARGCKTREKSLLRGGKKKNK